MGKRYEIINHGPEHSQYFQGCGVAYTPFNSVVTGIGDNAKAAYLDAIDSLYTIHESHQIERLHLPAHPHGIRASDSIAHEPAGPAWDEPSDYYWYVSIRYSI